MRLILLPLLLLASMPLACGGSAREPVAPLAPPPAVETTQAQAPAAAPAPAPSAEVAAPPPSQPEPLASQPAAPPAPPAAEPPAREEAVEGTLRARKGREVTIKLLGTPPEPGSKMSLERFFEGKPGDANPLGVLGGLLGGAIQGWMGIAAVTVKKVDKNVVTVTIDEEKSTMKVNGKKVDHFTSGAKVRLATSR